MATPHIHCLVSRKLYTFYGGAATSSFSFFGGGLTPNVLGGGEMVHIVAACQLELVMVLASKQTLLDCPQGDAT